MRNNFRFNDILDRIITEQDTLVVIVKELEEMNNSYAYEIARNFRVGDFEKAIVLLKSSCAFERRVNSVSTKAIILTEEEILARRDNLILINGVNKEEATLLAFRRASRLREERVAITHSIEAGTFIC